MASQLTPGFRHVHICPLYGRHGAGSSRDLSWRYYAADQRAHPQHGRRASRGQRDGVGRPRQAARSRRRGGVAETICRRQAHRRARCRRGAGADRRTRSHARSRLDLGAGRSGWQRIRGGCDRAPADVRSEVAEGCVAGRLGLGPESLARRCVPECGGSRRSVSRTPGLSAPDRRSCRVGEYGGDEAREEIAGRRLAARGRSHRAQGRQGHRHPRRRRDRPGRGRDSAVE